MWWRGCGAVRVRALRGAAAENVEKYPCGERDRKQRAVGTQQHGEGRSAAGENHGTCVLEAGCFRREDASRGVDSQRHGEDGEALGHGGAGFSSGEGAEHGESEGDFPGARRDEAVGEGREKKASDDVDDGLEKIESDEPAAMGKIAEELIEDGQNDGIGGQAEEAGRKIVAGAEPVDPVVQQIAAEFEVVPGIVVDGAGRPDEVEAEDEAQRDPERPTARPARRMDEAEHREKDTAATGRAAWRMTK